MTVLFVGEEQVSEEMIEEIESYCKEKDIPPSIYLREFFIKMWKVQLWTKNI
jgi:hypothetical protein